MNTFNGLCCHHHKTWSWCSFGFFITFCVIAGQNNREPEKKNLYLHFRCLLCLHQSKMICFLFSNFVWNCCCCCTDCWSNKFYTAMKRASMIAWKTSTKWNILIVFFLFVCTFYSFIHFVYLENVGEFSFASKRMLHDCRILCRIPYKMPIFSKKKL